jgi:hypothetical protein
MNYMNVHMTFEVITLTIKITVFWEVMACSLDFPRVVGLCTETQMAPHLK